MALISPCRIRTLKRISSCYMSVINKNFSMKIEDDLKEKSRTLKTKSINFGNTQSKDIKTFLEKSDVKFKDGYTCLICTCPRHVKRKLDIDQIDKLYINSTTGYFICHSCGKSGNWEQLKDNMEDILMRISKKKKKSGECFDGLEILDVTTDNKIEETFKKFDNLNEMTDQEWNSLSFHLEINDLTRADLEAFNVRTSANRDSVVFPAYDGKGRITAYKMAALHISDDKTTVRTTLNPRYDCQGLFGWNTVLTDTKEIVITANEWDAIVIRRVTGLVTIALPRGDTNLPQEVLPLLEKYDKITLWLGGTMKHWQNTRQFARKLNDSRCYLIRPSAEHPDALTAFRNGADLRRIVNSAKRVEHDSIVTFHSLRDDVFTELSMAEEMQGVKWQNYPRLNGILKGHRRGELTIFTGPTGSGKTTFMSDYSLDLCSQGVNTLWGSFEINNVRLIKTMLSQYSQVNLEKNIEMFDEYADAFELLPLYFMTFHGQENVRNVIQTMSHAVYVRDIAHVIVDNLQFMMGLDSTNDKYFQQDKIIGAFRKFATNMNCHVSLVIHPRKEKDCDELTVSSIFGSAKASQEADNILILQDKRLSSMRPRKYIQVAKNRYDGELGIVLLNFDRETKSFRMDATGEEGKKTSLRRRQ